MQHAGSLKLKFIFLLLSILGNINFDGLCLAGRIPPIRVIVSFRRCQERIKNTEVFFVKNKGSWFVLTKKVFNKCILIRNSFRSLDMLYATALEYVRSSD